LSIYRRSQSVSVLCLIPLVPHFHLMMADGSDVDGGKTRGETQQSEHYEK
jgi:hypothetical protein